MEQINREQYDALELQKNELEVTKNSIAQKYNYTKKDLQETRENLDEVFKIVLKTNNKELIHQVALAGKYTVCVRYYARPGEYTNKKGKTTECWYSAYGKYVGGKRANPTPPILIMWMEYKEEGFEIITKGKGVDAVIKIKEETFTFNRYVYRVLACDIC